MALQSFSRSTARRPSAGTSSSSFSLEEGKEKKTAQEVEKTSIFRVVEWYYFNDVLSPLSIHTFFGTDAGHHHQTTAVIKR